MFEGVEEVPSQSVRVAFFRIGDVRFELLEPTDPASTIVTFLDKRGEGLHHVALTVEGIDARIAELKQAGLRFVGAHCRGVRRFESGRGHAHSRPGQQAGPDPA